MHKRMTTFPRDERELVEMKEFSKEYKHQIKNNEKDIKKINVLMNMLMNFKTDLTDEYQSLYWGLKNWPHEIISAEVENRKAL
jgi:hypothetical protein